MQKKNRTSEFLTEREIESASQVIKDLVIMHAEKKEEDERIFSLLKSEKDKQKKRNAKLVKEGRKKRAKEEKVRELKIAKREAEDIRFAEIKESIAQRNLESFLDAIKEGKEVTGVERKRKSASAIAILREHGIEKVDLEHIFQHMHEVNVEDYGVKKIVSRWESSDGCIHTQYKKDDGVLDVHSCFPKEWSKNDITQAVSDSFINGSAYEKIMPNGSRRLLYESEYKGVLMRSVISIDGKTLISAYPIV